MAKGKELIRGLSGNNRQVTCKIRVLDDDPELTGIAVTPKLMAIEAGECIVAIKTLPEQEKYLEKAAAIIQNSGGKTSHGNVWANAKGKASIFNTAGVVQSDGSTHQYATEVLKDGQMVVVQSFTESIEEPQKDGTIKRRNYGAVFEYVPGEEEIPAAAPSAVKPSLTDLMAKYGVKR